MAMVAGDLVKYDTSKVVPPPLPRKSPMAVARTTLAGTYIKIVYGAPSKRGRIVFGALEPFGQVWRLGANETTELTTTAAIDFGGVPLSAGTYSLFAIPEPDKWTIIVNTGLGQWGAYDYDESLDVARFSLATNSTLKTYEALSIWFDEASGPSTKLRFAWDQTEVVVPITTR
jgi:hypothetical protein